MYSALLKIWGRHICSLSQLFLLGFTQEDGSPFRSNELWQYGQSMTLYAWRQLQSFHACKFHKNHFCSLRWIITFQTGEGCLYPWDHHQVTSRLSALTKAFVKSFQISYSAWWRTWSFVFASQKSRSNSDISFRASSETYLLNFLLDPVCSIIICWFKCGV